jgi:hypothetical protein
MLKRKWIIDNKGRLVATWSDCWEWEAEPGHSHQQPVSATTPAVRSHDRAAGRCRGTARRRRRCRRGTGDRLAFSHTLRRGLGDSARR